MENKKTTIADIPIVARAKENKEWKEGPVPTTFTSFYAINIITGNQKQLSFPKKNELDVDPQVVGSKLTWLRKKGKETQGDVWVQDGLSGHRDRWIINVDSAPVFFTLNEAIKDANLNILEVAWKEGWI